MRLWFSFAACLWLAEISPAAPVSDAPATNAPARSPGRTFEVRAYLVEGNTLLPPQKLASVLTNYVGPAVDLPRLTQGLGELQLLYRHLGFATVNITLPQQKLTNGIVRVLVTEGKLSDIVITGNHHFSDANIRRALPDLTTNILLNSHWFQPELNQANANPDRQIYPVIGPGPEPGTTELTLKVKDQPPLHGHLEINDKSSPGTPALRTDAAVQYNNLWQRNHQIGFNYDFSPQAMKNADWEPRFYDQPLIASYSGFYRLPLGSGGGLRDTFEHQPVDFGYDEITHSFRQLPATGNPELIVYASRSVSDTPVRYGPLSVVFTNTDATLNSQSAERDLTYNQNLGTKLTLPLREFAGVQSSFLLGVDYKSYTAPSFSTNLSTFSLYAKDATTGQPVLVTNSTLRLPSNRSANLFYLPLSFGWSATRPDPWGNTSFNFNENVFLAALGSARTNFQTVAATAAAGGTYTDITAGLTRRQNLGGDWTLLGRANGQWSSAPLISNEEMPLGGTAGVRGYQEAEVYGDDGWRLLLDLNAPALEVGEFPTGDPDGDVPARLRCSVFMDYGSTYLIDRPTTASLTYNEWGTGVGFFLTAGEHFLARLTVARALESTALTPVGTVRAYFSVGRQI